mmetsp:Transcript_39343/g.82398  ORF Transcript_39343/g.82398 Transcript_39343/m.82398 type:complete len:521 (-) Transcript_39343:2577-4139(-)
MSSLTINLRRERIRSKTMRKLEDAAAAISASLMQDSVKETPPMRATDILIFDTVLEEDVIVALVNLINTICTTNDKSSSSFSPPTVLFEECVAVYLERPVIRTALAKALGKCADVCWKKSPSFLSKSFLDDFFLAANTSESLECLHIHDRLATEQVEALALGLRSNTTLKLLGLSSSQIINADDFAILAKALRCGSFCLKRLELRRIKLKDVQLETMMGDQSSSSSSSSSSQLMECENVPCPMPALKFLELSFNCLRDVAYLGKFLSHPGCNLRRLSLGNQGIVEGGRIDISSIATAIETNQKLMVLELPGNGLADLDAILLANAIAKNCGVLETIDVTGNSISDIGIIRLAEAARDGNHYYKHHCDTVDSTKGLRRLKVAGNPFGVDGSLALLEAVSENFNIIYLDTNDANRNVSSNDYVQAVNKKICFQTALNRFGKSAIVSLEQPPLPLALWSFALNCAQFGVSEFAISESCSDEADSAYHETEHCFEDNFVFYHNSNFDKDILYYFLKEKATAFFP